MRKTDPSNNGATHSMDKNQWILNAVDANEQRLTAYAARLLNGDWEYARDVVQHAFMVLCDQQPNKIGDNPAPWLYRVCRNKALDHQRRRKRDLKVTEPDVAQQMKTVENNDPSKQLSDHELFELIQNSIGHLPEAQREAIDLWSHGFSYTEIANITSKKAGAIRVSVHRAIAQIKKHPSISAWLSGNQPLKPAIVSISETNYERTA